MGLGAILYAVMPADLINDMIPFLGILDDAIVLPFLIFITSKMIPDSVTLIGQFLLALLRLCGLGEYRIKPGHRLQFYTGPQSLQGPR